MIKAVADLDVFNISYALAMDIYHLAKNFPKEEKYSLQEISYLLHGITGRNKGMAAFFKRLWLCFCRCLYPD